MVENKPWAASLEENSTMTTWLKDELRRISDADDLHVAPLREDGVTYGTPTWIWSVAVNAALYARAYHGQRSCWYQAAMRQRVGRIMAAGVICDVGFQCAEGSVMDRIDEAYRAKHAGSPSPNALIGR